MSGSKNRRIISDDDDDDDDCNAPISTSAPAFVLNSAGTAGAAATSGVNVCSLQSIGVVNSSSSLNSHARNSNSNSSSRKSSSSSGSNSSSNSSNNVDTITPSKGKIILRGGSGSGSASKSNNNNNNNNSISTSGREQRVNSTKLKSAEKLKNYLKRVESDPLDALDSSEDDDEDEEASSESYSSADTDEFIVNDVDPEEERRIYARSGRDSSPPTRDSFKEKAFKAKSRYSKEEEEDEVGSYDDNGLDDFIVSDNDEERLKSSYKSKSKKVSSEKKRSASKATADKKKVVKRRSSTGSNSSRKIIGSDSEDEDENGGNNDNDDNSDDSDDDDEDDSENESDEEGDGDDPMFYLRVNSALDRNIASSMSMSSSGTMSKSDAFNIYVQHIAFGLTDSEFLYNLANFTRLTGNKGSNTYNGNSYSQFLASIRQVENLLCTSRESILASGAWGVDFTKVISSRPMFQYEHKFDCEGQERCSACNRTSQVSAVSKMYFFGCPYDSKAVWEYKEWSRYIPQVLLAFNYDGDDSGEDEDVCEKEEEAAGEITIDNTAQSNRKKSKIIIIDDDDDGNDNNKDISEIGKENSSNFSSSSSSSIQVTVNANPVTSGENRIFFPTNASSDEMISLDGDECEEEKSNDHQFRSNQKLFKKKGNFISEHSIVERISNYVRSDSLLPDYDPRKSPSKSKSKSKRKRGDNDYSDNEGDGEGDSHDEDDGDGKYRKLQETFILTNHCRSRAGLYHNLLHYKFRLIMKVYDALKKVDFDLEVFLQDFEFFQREFGRYNKLLKETDSKYGSGNKQYSMENIWNHDEMNDTVVLKPRSSSAQQSSSSSNSSSSNSSRTSDPTKRTSSSSSGGGSGVKAGGGGGGRQASLMGWLNINKRN